MKQLPELRKSQPVGPLRAGEPGRALFKMAPKKRAAPAPSAPMEPGGDSESWAQAQTNQMRIADLCLEDLPDAELKARTGPTWARTKRRIKGDSLWCR